VSLAKLLALPVQSSSVALPSLPEVVQASPCLVALSSKFSSQRKFPQSTFKTVVDRICVRVGDLTYFMTCSCALSKTISK
jgi:hypothetical protein